MENSQKTIMEALEDAHGMTHDIAFEIREGNIVGAKNILKSQDMLLHDTIEQESLRPKVDVFNTLANAIRTRI